MTPHLSSLRIDALVLGALDAAESTAARAHLEACPGCRDAVAATRAACQRFERAVLRQRVPPLARPRRLWVSLLAPALALAALVVVARRHEPSVSVKGGPALHVVAKRGESVFPVEPRARLRAGDQLRFAVEPAGWTYLAIGSIDAAGHASIYYPSQRLPTGTSVTLQASIVLDAAPGPERICALFSRAPLSAAEVLHALVAGGGTQISLTFEKEAP
ncbi:MAG TPA: zf-HC2 domain-containing protein [Burkholderiales bacterium]|nr:zf-HC2 domain-containing protein [Burkholderiales bacterium]